MNGAKYVLVPAAEYRMLSRRSPVQSPKPTDSVDTVDALEFTRSSIASGIVRDRAAVGMSQRELATAAGIRLDVLNRAERGVAVPSVKTLTKIESALVKAGLKRRPVR